MSAITEFTRLEGAIKRNRSHSLGCGGVIVEASETLPDGDYVAFQTLQDSASVDLENIVYTGQALTKSSGASKTAAVFSSRVGTTIFYANIKSCDVKAGGATTVFYHRCIS
jgi:hypothetical protein